MKMHSKRWNSREGRVCGISGELQISLLNWRVGVLCECRSRDIGRCYIPKGQAKNSDFM